MQLVLSFAADTSLPPERLSLPLSQIILMPVESLPRLRFDPAAAVYQLADTPEADKESAGGSGPGLPPCL